MNRRELLKFLGKAAVAAGIAAAIGLPEIKQEISTTISLDKYADKMDIRIPPGFPDDMYPLRLSNNENIASSFHGIDDDGALWVSGNMGGTWTISQIP